jgi:hypothetical protein
MKTGLFCAQHQKQQKLFTVVYKNVNILVRKLENRLNTLLQKNRLNYIYLCKVLFTLKSLKIY